MVPSETCAHALLLAMSTLAATRAPASNDAPISLPRRPQAAAALDLSALNRSAAVAEGGVLDPNAATPPSAKDVLDPLAALDYLCAREEELMDEQRKLVGRFAELNPPHTVQCVRCRIWCDSKTRFCHGCEEDERVRCRMFVRDSPSARAARAQSSRVASALAAARAAAAAKALKIAEAPAAPSLASSSDDEPQQAISARAATLAEATLIKARFAAEFRPTHTILPPPSFSAASCVRDGEMAALLAGVGSVTQHPDVARRDAVESSALCRECSVPMTTNPAFCATCRDDLAAATIDVGFVAHVEQSEAVNAAKLKLEALDRKRQRQRELHAARQMRARYAAHVERRKRAMSAVAMSMLAPSTPQAQQPPPRAQRDSRGAVGDRIGAATISVAVVDAVAPPQPPPAAAAAARATLETHTFESLAATVASAAAVALPMLGGARGRTAAAKRPAAKARATVTVGAGGRRASVGARRAGSAARGVALDGPVVRGAVDAIRATMETHARAGALARLDTAAPRAPHRAPSFDDCAAAAGCAQRTVAAGDATQSTQSELPCVAISGFDLATMSPSEASAFLLERRLLGVGRPLPEQVVRLHSARRAQYACKRRRDEFVARRTKRRRRGPVPREEELLLADARDMSAPDAHALLRRLQAQRATKGSGSAGRGRGGARRVAGGSAEEKK